MKILFYLLWIISETHQDLCHIPFCCLLLVDAKRKIIILQMINLCDFVTAVWLLHNRVIICLNSVVIQCQSLLFRVVNLQNWSTFRGFPMHCFSFWSELVYYENCLRINIDSHKSVRVKTSFLAMIFIVLSLFKTKIKLQKTTLYMWLSLSHKKALMPFIDTEFFPNFEPVSSFSQMKFDQISLQIST